MRIIDKLSRSCSPTRKVQGFAGWTHILISTLLLEIMWVLPAFKDGIEVVKSKGIIATVLFCGIVIGSALLNDLDNKESTARYQLGALGSILSMFMIMISSVVYNVLHTKKDSCKTQHRMFWHTTFVCVAGAVIAIAFIPDTDVTFMSFFTSLKDGNTVGINGSAVSIAFTYYIASVASFYLSVNVAAYRLGRLFGPSFFRGVKIALSAFAAVYMFAFVPISFMKFSGVATCLGAFFHNVGDDFSEGSTPVLFPIPIKGQIWWKPKNPIAIRTNGVGNKILNLALSVIDVAILAFIVGLV